jgi:hypothetical protein
MSAKRRRPTTVISLWIVEGNDGRGWAPVVEATTGGFVGGQTEKDARKRATFSMRAHGWKTRVREFRSVVRGGRQ